jgi:3'(2'), 5'-bisphosphate nucleotidase
MIGMIEDGRPVVGVVTRPVPFVTYAGGPGLGAFLLEGGVRMPIHVHHARELSEATVVISRSHRTPEIDRDLQKLGARQLSPYGSAGLKAIKVATGEVDLYAQTKNAGKRWDACAPEAIVVGAGGILTDAKGKLLDYRTEELGNVDGVLSGPPDTHHAALLRLGFA